MRNKNPDSKTYRQQIKILNGQIDRMQHRIDSLNSMLAEKEINPLDYQELGMVCMKYYQALMTIKLTLNAASPAWNQLTVR